MGTVTAVCTSPAKGTQKTNVNEALFIEDYGIQGDAHAGKWHRQVSLLSYDKIEAFRARGAEVTDGAFGENLVVQGIDFSTLPVGTRLSCGDVVLEITQIGKSATTAVRYFRKWESVSCPEKVCSQRWSGAGSYAQGMRCR